MDLMVKIFLLWMYGCVYCSIPSARSENYDEYRPAQKFLKVKDIWTSQLFWFAMAGAGIMLAIILMCMFKFNFFPESMSMSRSSKDVSPSCQGKVKNFCKSKILWIVLTGFLFLVTIILLCMYQQNVFLGPMNKNRSNKDEFPPGRIMVIDIVKSKIFWGFSTGALALVIVILICKNKCHFFPKPANRTKKNEVENQHEFQHLV